MKFSFLPSLGALAGWGLSRHGQTSFQAPHHATSPGPSHIRFPAYVFSNQALFIGNSELDYYSTSPENPFQTAIFSLDLSVPWSASAPAWHRIDRPADFVPDDFSNKSGQMVMNKDGSIIYFFQYLGVRPYYVHRGEWGPVTNLTSDLSIRKSLMVDSDLGHIYGIEWSHGYVWTLRMFDPVTNAISIVSEIPLQANPNGGRGVYSSARKSFFFLSSKGATTFHEYNIADKTWTFVRGSGDVPSPRSGVACYAPVNNGKQILLVGGAQSPSLESPSDIYVGYDEYEVAPTPTENWPLPQSSWPPQNKIPTAAWSTYPTRSTQQFILPGDSLPTHAHPSRRTSMDEHNQVANDVFMFDVETSVWTKVSTTPVGYYGSACAVSGDSLILYGGYKGLDMPENDDVPSIYDMKKNTWVSTYIPH
ncbi:hypothetical protein BG000_002641 [Podila horticola]|nr:hypothetical protein BG000_002641 [Podila horticola]